MVSSALAQSKRERCRNVSRYEAMWWKRRKKRAAVAGGFEVDNREASNRVDRSHSVSKEDADSHTWESLIDRKRAIFFRLCLPYRPLAEWGSPSPLKSSPRTRGRQ